MDSTLDNKIAQAIQNKGYDPTDLEMMKNAGQIVDRKGIKTLFINDDPICYWYQSEPLIVSNTDGVKATVEIYFKEF